MYVYYEETMFMTGASWAPRQPGDRPCVPHSPLTPVASFAGPGLVISNRVGLPPLRVHGKG